MSSITTLQPEATVYWNMEFHYVYDQIFYALDLTFTVAQTLFTAIRNKDIDDIYTQAHYLQLLQLQLEQQEYFAAICVAIKRRFFEDTNCVFQKVTLTASTPICYTLLNYKPSTTIALLGSNDTDIMNHLRLDLIDQHNISFIVPSFDSRLWKQNLVSFINGVEKERENREHMYLKLKHGKCVVSDGFHFQQRVPHKGNVLLPPGIPAILCATEGKRSDVENLKILPTIKAIGRSKEQLQNEANNCLNAIKSLSDAAKGLLSLYVADQFPDIIKAKYNNSLLIFLRKAFTH